MISHRTFHSVRVTRSELKPRGYSPSAKPTAASLAVPVLQHQMHFFKAGARKYQDVIVGLNLLHAQLPR